MSSNLGGADRALYHWHPVLLGSDLGREPVGVKVHGHQMVVFRTSTGVAALDDRCPHRGARLSAGSVADDCVVCPYHLWRFDGDGHGQSPVNPRMRPFTRAFDVVEREGLVWLKPKDADAPFPLIDRGELHFLGCYGSVIEAPFALVADNFTEIEHSPTNHFLFAFDAEGIKQVEPRVDVLDDAIHIVYAGPQRPQPWWALARVIGVHPGVRHVIDFRVRFSPLYWAYDLTWEDPSTGAPLPDRIREFAFVTPRDEKSTSVFLLFFTSIKLLRPGHPLGGLVRRFFLTHAHKEFLLDQRICENVADMTPGTDLDGLQLGRFDHVLRSVRRMTGSIYRRGAPPVEADRARDGTRSGA
jgi:vanillate O-demethylase monooxygenase subunit